MLVTILGATEHKPATWLLVQRWSLAAQALASALISGGMLALGAITAPTVFSELSRDMAGPLMGEIFQRYDMVLLVALTILCLGELLGSVARKRLGYPLGGYKLFNLHGLRLGFLLVLAATLLYAIQVVNPSIWQMQKAGLHRGENNKQSQAFDKAHHLSESLYKLDLLIGLVLLGSVPFAVVTFSYHPGPHRRESDSVAMTLQA